MKVWVAAWDHQYGTDVAAFSSEQKAQDWKNAIACDWWEREFDEERPEDDEELGDEYFKRMANGEGVNEFAESFTIRLCELDEVNT